MDKVLNKLKVKHIYPVFEQIINQADKEKLLKQKAKVIWLTGLSGAGKTTIGYHLEKELYQLGNLTQVLDGDNIRSGINNNLGFTAEDRMENIRRISEVTKLFLNCGIITINCFITPTENLRQIARDIIGRENMIEVYVNASLAICERRDIKGLYKKARAGELKDFTGIDAPFEIPLLADIVLNTENQSVEESTRELLQFVIGQISYK